MARPRQPRRSVVANASDVEQVKRGRETDRARVERETREKIAVWSTREGRACYWRWISECGVFRSPMEESPHWTAFYAGRQEIGQQLLADITELAPELYLLMQSEAIQLAEQSRVTDAKPDSPERSEDTDG
jgi:hypothetical protein